MKMEAKKFPLTKSEIKNMIRKMKKVKFGKGPWYHFCVVTKTETVDFWASNPKLFINGKERKIK
jgi:hypothetical protein